MPSRQVPADSGDDTGGVSALILAELAKLHETISTVTNLVTEVRIEQGRQRDVLSRVEQQVTATNGRVSAIETREAAAKGRVEGEAAGRAAATRTVAVTWKAVVGAAGLVGVVAGLVFQFVDHL